MLNVICEVSDSEIQKLTLFSNSSSENQINPAEFETALKSSIQEWKSTGVRGLWFHVRYSHYLKFPVFKAKLFKFRLTCNYPY